MGRTENQWRKTSCSSENDTLGGKEIGGKEGGRTRDGKERKRNKGGRDPKRKKERGAEEPTSGMPFGCTSYPQCTEGSSFRECDLDYQEGAGCQTMTSTFFKPSK